MAYVPVEIRAITATVATLEKRRTARRRSPFRSCADPARIGPSNASVSPSSPPVHNEAAPTCSQSARKGSGRASAAAWLTCVRVTSKTPPMAAAAHQRADLPGRAAQVAAAAARTPRPTRAAQTLPTRVSNNACWKSSVLKGCPDASIAYNESSTVPATASRPSSAHTGRTKGSVASRSLPAARVAGSHTRATNAPDRPGTRRSPCAAPWTRPAARSRSKKRPPGECEPWLWSCATACRLANGSTLIISRAWA
jgi:hypothetical protein